jgi:hypothetical protein
MPRKIVRKQFVAGSQVFSQSTHLTSPRKKISRISTHPQTKKIRCIKILQIPRDQSQNWTKILRDKSDDPSRIQFLDETAANRAGASTKKERILSGGIKESRNQYLEPNRAEIDRRIENFRSRSSHRPSAAAARFQRLFSLQELFLQGC